MTQKKGFFQSSHAIHYIIALVLMVVISLVLQPGNGLTELGVRTLAFVVAAFYLFSSVNEPYLAFLIAPLMVFLGLTSGDSVGTNYFANANIILLLVFSFICANLTSKGVVDKIATWFITRPIAQGRPYMFLTLFLLSKLVIGIFMENVTVSILYIALVEAICEKVGSKKGDSLHFALMMGTVWAGGVISVSSPIAKICPNITLGLMKSQLGLSVSYAQWLAIGIPFSVISLIAILLVTRFIIKPDMTPLKNVNVEVFASGKPMTKAAKVSAIAMLVLVALIVLPDMLISFGFGNPVFSYIKSIPIGVMAMFAVFLMSFAQCDGEPVMNFRELLPKAPLHLSIFQGALFIISAPLGAAETGIVAWLGGMFTPILSGLSTFGVFVALMVVVLVLTQFMSNVVAFMLVFNIGVAVLANTGFNLVAVGLMATIASGLAFLLPSSSVGMPLWFGPGHINVGRSAVSNVCFIVLTMIGVIALVPLAQVVIPM